MFDTLVAATWIVAGIIVPALIITKEHRRG